MRLFVALNLPEEERNRIHKDIRPLRDAGLPVRWVEPDHYHLTLKFLGEVHPERVPLIEKSLVRVAAGTLRFDARVGGVGAFPTIRRPRVLWVGVEASPALRCLKQDVEWGLTQCGFERETRAFHPHLTLGRTVGEGGAGSFRGLDTMVAELECAGAFPVHKVDLMSSKLSRHGPRYTILSSSDLSMGR